MKIEQLSHGRGLGIVSVYVGERGRFDLSISYGWKMADGKKKRHFNLVKTHNTHVIAWGIMIFFPIQLTLKTKTRLKSD